MKILITGATGFIGNCLVPILLKQNHQIIATGIENKKDVNNEWIDRVTYIKHEINHNSENCYDLFQKPDKLIHLAWEGLPNYNELFHFEKNLYTSYFFLKNLIEEGLKDITVIGTCSEYGMQSGPLKESDITMPSHAYSLAKDTLRKFLGELNKKIPFNLKWIRLFYMYGKGQSKNSILEQLKDSIERGDKIFNMSGGEQLRDYLPVEKVAEYIAAISLNDKISGIINCCSGEPISIRKLVESYLKDNNKNIELNLGFYPYSDYEPMAFWGDNSKQKKFFNEE